MNKIMKFNTGNMPVILAIFSYASMHIALLAFKLAIKIGYPFLGTKIDFNQKTPEAIVLLLNKIDDGRIKILNCLHLEIQRAIKKYAEGYVFYPTMFVGNASIEQVAGDFYSNFMVEVEFGEVKSWDRDLYFFFKSLSDLFDLICELVIEGEIDLSATHDQDGNWIMAEDRDYSAYLDAEIQEHRLVTGLAKSAAGSLQQFEEIIYEKTL